MFEQLSLAYDYGIERMWILNVGDLKPMEYPIQLFLDMAWSPKQYTQQTVTNHTRAFFRSVLGDNIADNGALIADEAADIYNRNCQYMARVTAEMLDAETYDVASGEWQRVADEYQRLELRTLRLYMQLPEAQRDAFNELLLFPVQAMANIYEMYYAQAMNRYLAAHNMPDANLWADRVAECFRRDSLLCLSYNRDIAGGKWNGMMTQKHIGYTSWNDNFARDIMPQTQRVDAQGMGGYTFTAASAGNDEHGYVAMEAEHFFSADAAEGTQWAVYPDYGRTRSAVSLTPVTAQTGESKLTYRISGISIPASGRVKVHVVVKSTLDFLDQDGHEYTVSLDGSQPVTINFNKTLVDRQPYMYEVFYPTVARRVVESVVELPIADAAVHTLTLHPKHPGIVFEKVVVDLGGYRKQYLFGEESPVSRSESAGN